MAWQIDPSHSQVAFSVKHLAISTVRGRFSLVSGAIELDDKNLANSTVEVVIQTASIDTRDEKRDGHLRSADFFDVDTYPTATFKSTSITANGDEEFKVTGNLTLHGVTKEETFDVTYNGQAKSPFGFTVAAFTGYATVNRKDYGLNWNVALEAGGVMVSDKVKLELEIEAIQQQPVQAEAATAGATA